VIDSGNHTIAMFTVCCDGSFDHATPRIAEQRFDLCSCDGARLHVDGRQTDRQTDCLSPHKTQTN
jgi:hypothetical protein